MGNTLQSLVDAFDEARLALTQHVVRDARDLAGRQRLERSLEEIETRIAEYPVRTVEDKVRMAGFVFDRLSEKLECEHETEYYRRIIMNLVD